MQTYLRCGVWYRYMHVTVHARFCRFIFVSGEEFLGELFEVLKLVV